MMKEKYLVLAFLILTTSIVSYQLIDPKLEEQPTEIDLAESPAEIAYDGLRQTQTWDYTYTETWTVTVENETKTVRISRTKVEHSDDQYFREYFTDRFAIDTTAKYGNEVRDWLKYDSWTRDSTLHPYHDEYSPFERLGHVRTANVTVVNQSDDVLVLRIENRSTVDEVTRYFEPQKRSNSTLTLSIDRKDGHLRKATVRNVSTNLVEKKIVTYQFNDFGETTVTRPDGIEYTLDEFLRDLFDKPKTVK